MEDAVTGPFQFPAQSLETNEFSTQIQSLDDWEVLAAIKTSSEALAILFERHKAYVHRIAWGVLGDSNLADDVTQEVFLRLAKGSTRFKPRARFTTLLYRLTINTSRELARQRLRHQGSQLEHNNHHANKTVSDTAATSPAGVTRMELRSALGSLSQRQREVVVLRCLEGFSTEETAEILGCRGGTVKIHLHRARRALKEYLQ